MSGERYLSAQLYDHEAVRASAFNIRALMFYPNDIFSAQVLAEVLHSEDAQESHMATLISSDLSNREGRACMAGEVVRCLAELHANDMPTSLNRAKHLTIHTAGGVRRLVGRRIPTTQSNVDAAFREFKDVAHLWAASNYMGSQFHSVSSDPQSFAVFLGVSERFQWLMINLLKRPIADWNPWLVPQDFEMVGSALAVPVWNDEVKSVAENYYARRGN